MIIFSHLGKDYELRNEWKDITLSDAIKISAVQLPDTEDWFDWFKHIDKVCQMLSLFGTFKGWTSLSPSVCVHLFVKNVLPMVQDLHSETPKTYAPKLLTQFDHDGLTYLMPTNLEIGGETILQHGQTIKSFIESSNLMKAFSEMRTEGIKVMPYLIASVVKLHPEEAWDEIEISKRAESFGSLTMDKFWEVFFCISLHIFKHASDTLQSMTAEKQPKTLLERMEARLDLKRGRLRWLRQELSEHWIKSTV